MIIGRDDEEVAAKGRFETLRDGRDFLEATAGIDEHGIGDDVFRWGWVRAIRQDFYIGLS